MSTSDALKCRDFLTQLRVHMPKLRLYDDGTLPMRGRGVAIESSITVDL